jgi:hypothetical protein
VPNTWYVILRLGQGFAAGVVVGALWALWIIRQRRTAGPPGPDRRPSAFRIEKPGAADRLATG